METAARTIALDAGRGDYLAAVRRQLGPKMLAAVATCAGEGSDLRGLYHGSTLNGLIRQGLARKERGWGIDDHVIVLTGLGLQLRDDLRARVDRELEAAGFARVVDGKSVPSLYRCPVDGDGTVTRAGAMRRSGVQW